MTAEAIAAGPFDERFLRRSYDWLRDSELARLARVSTQTLEEQQAWFDSLPARTDYAVWGLTYDGVPVGVVGLRGIGIDGGAEEFLYIGERAYWGLGIGGWALTYAREQARALGLRQLRARVGRDNPRSLAVHLRHGFTIVGEDDQVHHLVVEME